ncbi:tetratricopeptide repeat protein [Oscillatoria salina]|uniref:tetratricopeptide repeat protein n=1 Tax=Oscillatoria salina TaxID=331517 RepID=UPI0013B6E48D|nr:tetratricopeptide repeat protein [Oscillatoria salina]MBZ8180736.1 tetratricopeptide repeat protein [Oscillatoria salina IIICB1]NET91073.1 tetratricopeptide repeat protein [Kamptonema sp. SIO1D9]
MNSPIILLQEINEEISPTELWEAAKICLKIGKLNQSLTLAYKIVQEDSTQQENYQKHYLEAIELGAEFAEEIGDYPRAAYYWEQMTQHQPNDSNAWYGLGIAKANLRDYQGAERALNQCLQLQPGNSNARSHLLEIQQLLQR